MQKYDCDVVIVGAGIAGLTAALTVLDEAAKARRKLPSILILEAADECGGRVRDMEIFPHIHVNKGANWFHALPNPFFNFLKDRYGDSLGAYKNDRALNTRTVTDTESYGTIATGLSEWTNFKYLQGVFRWWEKENGGDTSVAKIAELTHSPDYYREIADYIARYWAGLDSSETLSAREAFAELPVPGGYQLALGNSTFIKLMVGDLAVNYSKQVRIQKDSCVISVKETGAGVSVDFRRTAPAAKLETVVCRKCVVTASVGVLKESIEWNAIRDRVNKALRKIEMAHMCKIVAPIDPQFFRVNKIRENFYLINRQKKSQGFWHMQTYGKPIITFFLAGENAIEAESWDDKKLKKWVDEQITSVPDLYYLSDYVTQGLIKKTDWSKNPYTRGAYSSSRPKHERTGPLEFGSVYLAGEAFAGTIKQRPSMMAGAYNSGVMAGKMVYAKL